MCLIRQMTVCLIKQTHRGGVGAAGGRAPSSRSTVLDQAESLCLIKQTHRGGVGAAGGRAPSPAPPLCL